MIFVKFLLKFGELLIKIILFSGTVVGLLMMYDYLGILGNGFGAISFSDGATLLAIAATLLIVFGLISGYYHVRDKMAAFFSKIESKRKIKAPRVGIPKAGIHEINPNRISSLYRKSYQG